MLNRWQVNIVFVVFIFIILVLTISEAYLIISVARGDASWVSGATALITLLFISAAGKVFLDISKRNFLDGERLPVSSLTELAAEKARVSSNPELSDGLKRVEMMRSILNFARNRISDWAKGAHFEFCIFADKEFPTMVAYTDSALQSRNRSMSRRDENPMYYREKMYEAVKLLDSPQSQIHYIKDTQSSDVDYSFVREEQKRQIRSSLLACTDTDSPVIFVVSSDSKDAFDLEDQEFNAFIRFLLEMIHEQTADGRFVALYRKAHPEHFMVLR